MKKVKWDFVFNEAFAFVMWFMFVVFVIPETLLVALTETRYAGIEGWIAMLLSLVATGWIFSIVYRQFLVFVPKDKTAVSVSDEALAPAAAS